MGVNKMRIKHTIIVSDRELDNILLGLNELKKRREENIEKGIMKQGSYTEDNKVCDKLTERLEKIFYGGYNE